MDQRAAAAANARTVDSITLNDFEGTDLVEQLKRIRAAHGGAPLKVGVIGVWTEAKVSFLLYDLKTRLGIDQLGTCTALTASASRSQHFNARRSWKPDRVEIQLAAIGGSRQRLECHLALAAQVQDDPAGDQHGELRTRRQQLTQLVSR